MATPQTAQKPAGGAFGVLGRLTLSPTPQNAPQALPEAPTGASMETPTPPKRQGAFSALVDRWLDSLPEVEETGITQAAQDERDSQQRIEAILSKSEDEEMNRDAFLQLVGSKEAPAGYNQMFGERKPSTNLTNMTLNDVVALQAGRVASGVKSSAVGRYQFLRKTLLDLKKTLKLSGDEVFDEKLQDRLAEELMKRRGLEDYLAGKLTKEEFANNLAKEWASLPVVTGSKAGKSYYDGDGLNKALITPAAVLRTLE